MFERSREWFRTYCRPSNKRRGLSSYWLKHVAGHDIGYVTSGPFVAAAIAEGYRVRRIGRTPNAELWLALNGYWSWRESAALRGGLR